MSPLRSTLHLGCVEEPDAAEAAGQARSCCSRTATLCLQPSTRRLRLRLRRSATYPRAAPPRSSSPPTQTPLPPPSKARPKWYTTTASAALPTVCVDMCVCVWQNGPLVGPYGSTPVVEGELQQLVSETDEERAAIEAWGRLWMAMSVRRLARQREAIEKGRASPQSSMRSAPALDGGPLSVRTRFNQGLAAVRAAVEDQGLEAVRARFIYACSLQAGESPNLAPISPVVMRQAEGRVAPGTPVTPLGETGGAEAGARTYDGLWYRRRDSVNSTWYMLNK